MFGFELFRLCQCERFPVGTVAASLPGPGEAHGIAGRVCRAVSGIGVSVNPPHARLICLAYLLAAVSAVCRDS